MKAFLFVTAFLFLLMFSGNAHAVPESFCPGGSNPSANILKCDNFDTLDPGWQDSGQCCYPDGPGSANGLPDGNGPQRGSRISDPRAMPGGVDPGKCDLPSNNDCGLVHKTTFQGNQGFASPNAFWSNYYWPCCGNYYGNISIGSTVTEMHVRFYVYLNDGWPLPTCHPGIPVTSGNNCGAKLLMLDDGGNSPTSNGYLLLYSAEVEDARTTIDTYAGPPGREATHQNIAPLTLRNGPVWYLYEWHVKMNTGSNYDGVSELWIDEATPGVAFVGPQTLRERHTDMRFGGANGIASVWRRIGLSPNSNYGYCHHNLLGNDGVNAAPPCHVTSGIIDTTHPNAYYRVSNIVVSAGNTPIGPVGGGTIPTIKVPKPPPTFTLTP